MEGWEQPYVERPQAVLFLLCVSSSFSNRRSSVCSRPLVRFWGPYMAVLTLCPVLPLPFRGKFYPHLPSTFPEVSSVLLINVFVHTER